MEEVYRFEPPRQVGFVFHIVVIVMLAVAAGWLVFLATEAELGPTFLLYLFSAALLALPLPLLAYRLYSLQLSAYVLGRDGVRLRWGLRQEEIPASDLLWAYSLAQIETTPPLPFLRWFGSVVGARHDRKLGAIEYMAAQTGGLVFVGTRQRVFALSPRDPAAFLRAYHQLMELGSLEPLAARSVYPTFLLAELWRDRWARILLLAGIVLNLALLVWVGLAIPGRRSISFGFAPSGAPLDPAPAVQLFLLPVASLFFFLTNFILAAYFHRQAARHPLAYLMWGMNILTPVLFLLAVFMILRV